MRRTASSRTVSTSTDSSPSATQAQAGTDPANPRPRRTPQVVTRLAAIWRAASEWVSHFLTTPAWRWTKRIADGTLLLAVTVSIGWAAANGVFVAHRASVARGQVLIHLGGLPTVKFSPITGKATATTLPPTVVLEGVRSDRISITLNNDGPDGTTLVGGTLTGPYFPSPVKLLPINHHDYVGAGNTGLLAGTVTVDCNATMPVSHALVGGRPGSTQPATTLTVTAKDTNGTVHTVPFTLDTTAFAVQARVCTK